MAEGNMEYTEWVSDGSSSSGFNISVPGFTCTSQRLYPKRLKDMNFIFIEC